MSNNQINFFLSHTVEFEKTREKRRGPGLCCTFWRFKMRVFSFQFENLQGMSVFQFFGREMNNFHFSIDDQIAS